MSRVKVVLLDEKVYNMILGFDPDIIIYLY